MTIRLVLAIVVALHLGGSVRGAEVQDAEKRIVHIDDLQGRDYIDLTSSMQFTTSPLQTIDEIDTTADGWQPLDRYLTRQVHESPRKRRLFTSESLSMTVAKSI
jgi:hypothetical protein